MVCREPELPPSEGFVLEREELDLWVMDIPFETSEILNDQFTNIFDHLVIHKETLKQIGRGYEDFALSLEFSLPIRLVSLPLYLIDLASECRFQIGIISDQMADYDHQPNKTLQSD